MPTYFDANGTDGSDPTRVHKVYSSGLRILMSDAAAIAAQDAIEAARTTNTADVDTRYDALTALKGKTPAQIYTYIQGRVDAWASLADAKADLRVWLPFVFALVIWKLQEK